MAEIKTSDIINGSELTKELQAIIDKFNALLGVMKQTSGEFQKSTNSTKKLTEADKKASEEKKQQIAAEKELLKQKQLMEKERQDSVKKSIAAAQKEAEQIEKAAQRQAAAENKAAQEMIKAREKKVEQAKKDANALIALEEKAAAARLKAEQSSKRKDEKAAIKAENEAKKESIRISKQQEQEQKKVTAQRNREIAAMQKQAQKQQEVARAANMEVKSDADLNTKLKAQIELRSKINKTTEQGKKAYDNMTASINKLKAEQVAANKSIGKFNDNVGNYPKMGANIAALATGFLAAFAAAKQLYGAVKESIDLFIEQEKQSFRVKQAFGDYAGVINDAADANQMMTSVGNEQYQKLAVLAHSYGVANKDVNETVKQSIGLSTMFEAAGIGQEQAMQMLVKAQNGQYMSLKRVIPEIADAANQQEALDIINRKAAEGYQVAQKYAETYGGRLEQIKNASGDLKETIGEGVLTGLFTTDEAGNAVNIINELNKALSKSGIVKEYFKGVSDMAKMIFEPVEKIAKSLGLATDGGSTLLLIFDGLVKYMQIMMIPAKMFWAQISNGVDIAIGLFNIFKDLKNFKIQDIFNIANKAIVNLLEPITDLIGATDDVKKFFGVARDEINLTAQEQEKFNNLLFDYKAIVKDAKDTIALNNELKNQNSILEDEEKAVEKAQEAYKSYLDTITKINEEYQIMIQFLKSDADLKQAAVDRDQKLFDASLSYYKKITPEMQKMMDSYKIIVSEAEKLEKIGGIQVANPNDIQLIKDAAIETENYYMKMLNIVNGFDLAATKPKTFFEEMIESAKKFSDFWDKNGEAIETTLSGISDGISSVYDNQINKQQLAADNNAKYYDNLLENYDQDSAEYQQLLAQKEAAQEKYQARLVELERKKAAFDKIKALIDIAINTAKGIVVALGNGNPILSAAIGVTGAIQAGVVASQPLPQYYVGLDSADKDHFGSVAERGAELVNYPDGTSELFTKPTVTFIPKYTSIDTAAETAKKLAGAQFTADLTELNNSSRESIKYLGIIARNTQSRQSATDLHYLKTYFK